MTLTKTTDVKNHLSATWRKRNRTHLSVGQPSTTGVSGTELGDNEIEPLIFLEDFVVEHSSRVISIAPTAPLTGATVIRVPDVSRSPQQ